MATTKKTAAKSKAKPVAQTREEAAELVGEIGSLDRQVTAIETRMNEKLAELKAKYEEEARPLNEQIEAKREMVQGWAEANRDELCPDDVKTVKLTTGNLSWRLNPPSVKVSGGDTTIENLKGLGFGRFVRTKEEVNKEAILLEPEAVKGVKGITITQGETFAVKPFESEIEHESLSKRQAA